MVVKATGSAEQLFSDVTGEFANDAVRVFDVRLGSHISRVLGAKEFQPEFNKMAINYCNSQDMKNECFWREMYIIFIRCFLPLSSRRKVRECKSGK